MVYNRSNSILVHETYFVISKDTDYITQVLCNKHADSVGITQGTCIFKNFASKQNDDMEAAWKSEKGPISLPDNGICYCLNTENPLRAPYNKTLENGYLPEPL